MNELLDQTTAIQRSVGNPHASAWVSANAGTGKTYVLVRRVVRQLLAGAAPASILCITFTKAAAAEMADRLLGMLSEWALLPDRELQKAVAEVTGERPPLGDLAAARRLFAQALESPGGLKIQTIHSFCSSVLARFPAEAGLPLGFRALEDDEAAVLLRQAVREVAQEAAIAEHPLHDEIRLLTERFEGEQEDGPGFQLSLEDILRTFARKTRGLMGLGEGRGELGRVLADVLCIEDQSPDDVIKACWEGMDRRFLAEVMGAFSQGTKEAVALAGAIRTTLETGPDETFLDRPFMLTLKFEPRSIKWKVKQQVADFDERWAALCGHVLDALDRLRRIRCFDENARFLKIAFACLHRYETKKHDLLALDYDDLVERTLALLRDVDKAWVHYKLDAGLDHILLDEAQDTSLAQWQLVDQLIEEVASGGDADGSRSRSLFVVGDPKQSIYAFNGAEAQLFRGRRETYKERFEDRLICEELFVSFRTSQAVLDVVDAAFDREEFRAVSGGYKHHRSSAPERRGRVTLWPHFPKLEPVDPPIWDRPVDSIREESIDRRVALAIAESIRERIGSDAKLACRNGARATASDVMVLFQRRGARFRETLKALAELGIPCAGTDRVAVAQDIAVQDLIALLRFAVNRDDSLSLATLLKSPFFAWSEEQLFALCAERQSEVLWLELKARARGGDPLAPLCAGAERELTRIVDAGTRHGPYRLLTEALDGGEAGTGRKRLGARLGDIYQDAVDTLLDEALAFEEAEPRSLVGFLHRAENLTRDIKREIAGEQGAGVRVMTVHGAKGLEAPVVFLGDADYFKQGKDARRFEPFVYAEHPRIDGPLPILSGRRRTDDPKVVQDLRRDLEDRRVEEYERLFYVAATRAKEELVICGGREADTRSWHRLATEGFDRLDGDPRLSRSEAPWGGTIVTLADGKVPPPEDEAKKKHGHWPVPAWINERAPAEPVSPAIYPSLMGDREEETQGRVRERSPTGGDPRARGSFVHRLLEWLPLMPRETWQTHAEKLAKAAPAGLDAETAMEAAASALNFLGDPRFAHLFGEGSRAEVSIQGVLDGRVVSGQIDRLVITEDSILAAEFKSTVWIPATKDDVPTAHERQLGAYLGLLRQLAPGKTVTGVLVYTSGPVSFVFG